MKSNQHDKKTEAEPKNQKPKKIEQKRIEKIGAKKTETKKSIGWFSFSVMNLTTKPN